MTARSDKFKKALLTPGSEANKLLNKVSFTRTVTITREQIPAKLIDDLKKVKGLPPYNGFNPAQNDGYFWAAIKREFGDDMIAAAEALVIGPMEREVQQALDEISRRFS